MIEQKLAVTKTKMTSITRITLLGRTVYPQYITSQTTDRRNTVS